ncbi:transcription antitermination factor NusB, partial [Actinotalea sp. AC32]|nr:transcription antitermination factor NusB [Actinotalea sp. AC32]
RGALAPSERRRGGDPARTAAFDVLREVATSDAYANLVLPPLLRRRGVRGRDAAFATELAYGALRLRGRYDAVVEIAADRPADRIDPPVLDVLRLGAHQLLGMRVPAHAAVSETVALARTVVGAGAAQFVNAVLRRVSTDPLDVWLDRVGAAAGDEIEALAVRHSHPAWVVRALRQALVADGRDPAELAALLEADNTAPAVTLVARPGLADRDEVLGSVEGASPGRWSPAAVVLGGGDPHDVAGVERAAVGVQDEGSQLVALALVAASPTADGERWLDLCAGPGGKTALLGAVAARTSGTVVATEVQPHRARLVEASVAAVPRGVVTVRCADGRTVGSDEPASFDRVLVDAPCTGLGALRRRPESRWRRSPADVPELGALQRDLLGSALDAVRPGGLVAYVTCSPHVAETRLVVQDVLRRRPDVEQLDVRPAVRAVAGDAIPLGDGPAVQLWPHVHGTDAMFLALMRRDEDGASTGAGAAGSARTTD